jgi:hypothetical protein
MVKPVAALQVGNLFFTTAELISGTGLVSRSGVRDSAQSTAEPAPSAITKINPSIKYP